MKLKRNIIPVVLMLTIVLSVFTMFQMHAFGASDEMTTVRVGFPIQKGITEIDANGNYTGYTYDYLMEIAQYADWKYEYVLVEGDIDYQLTAFLDMLAEGDIDLLGCMAYSDSLAELFDYSSSNYGMAYNALCVLGDSNLNNLNYSAFPKLRVIVPNSSGRRNEKLDQFAQMSGFEVDQIFTADIDEQMRLLHDGEADAVLFKDISIPSDELRVIARFFPQPFYFATTKDNKKIVNDLNFAMANINVVNPYFSINLHEKYFDTQYTSFFLSDGERDYVNGAEILQVLMLDGEAPLQYWDDKNGQGKGISKDVLEYITDKSGLEFEIVWAYTYDQYLKAIEDRDVDIVAGVAVNYDVALQEAYRMSIPYITSPVAIVVNRSLGISDLGSGRLALVRGFSYNVGKEDKVAYYDSIEECINAVEKGEADYCYGNGYSIQYYLRANNYRNVDYLALGDDWSQKICMGIIKPAEVELLSIVNKAVQSMSDEEMQNLLYTNSFEPEDITLSSYIKANKGQAVLLLLLTTSSFAAVFFMWKMYNNRKENVRMKLENQRYEQISELSNEFLYEYDIKQDRLTMPAKSSEFLGCDKVSEHVSELVKTLKNRDEDSFFLHILTAKEGSDEFPCRVHGGRVHWLRMTSKVVCDDSGFPTYVIGKVVDIQDEKERNEKLLDMAQKDGLTGIYNAATGRQLITTALENGGGALFILDIDHFKDINDTYGHHAGDRVLIQLTDILRDVFGIREVIARLGGDEFVVFMKDETSFEVVSGRCGDVCNRAEKVIFDDGKNMTVSIGAVIIGRGQDFDRAYKMADDALYTVKNRGRNGYEVFSL